MKKLLFLFLLSFIFISQSCSYQRCVKTLTEQTQEELLNGDDFRIKGLVKKRLKTIEEAKLAVANNDKVRFSYLKFSVDVYERTIKLIVQIKNLTFRSNEPQKVLQKKELFAKIRCMAEEFIIADDLVINEGNGNKLAKLGSEFDATFESEGRPLEIELESIYEGKNLNAPRQNIQKQNDNQKVNQETPINEKQKLEDIGAGTTNSDTKTKQSGGIDFE